MELIIYLHNYLQYILLSPAKSRNQSCNLTHISTSSAFLYQKLYLSFTTLNEINRRNSPKLYHEKTIYSVAPSF